MSKIILKILIFFALSNSCYAKVEIAYIEIRNSNGKIVQLEPNGRFAHIAIAFGNMWLHSHPYRGVELVRENDLKLIGKIYKISYNSADNLTDKNIAEYLNHPYDNNYLWERTGLYCSELVGKLLNIKPLPMSFSMPIWNQISNKSRGSLGLSPDDIYQIMETRESEYNHQQCKSVFKKM